MTPETPWVGIVGLVLALIIAVYPYLALGRIWLYSKQQVELLREIRAALEKTDQSK
jgi:hypothetical protein